MRVKNASGNERTGARANAHVVVCGNEKGGSGKSTLSMHVIVALLRSGFKVASIDLDSRQKTLTRYIENRQRWTRESGHQSRPAAALCRREGARGAGFRD